MATNQTWGWVIPRGGKKKPIILDAFNNDEISAICEAEIHGLGYFPLFVIPQKDRVSDLENALRDVRTAIIDADPEVLCCTLWMPDDIIMGATVVDYIDLTLKETP